jgi:hypothetical protein
MTSQTTPRYGFSFFLMVAALVAIAVASSVWAKGTSVPMTPDNARIDVSMLMMSVDIANLPVLHVENPI